MKRGPRPRTLPRLTAAEFDRLRPALHRLAPQNMALARRALVDGVEVPALVKEFELTRQRVYILLNTVLAHHAGIPSDWEFIAAWVPPRTAASMRRSAEKGDIHLVRDASQ